jgi:rod shape-determining protein MreC
LKLLFARGPQLGLRLILLVILAIVFMVLDHHRARIFTPVRNTLSTIAAPIQYLVSTPIKWVATFSTHLASRQSLLADNAQLHAQQLLLQAKLQQLSALQNENIQLRALLSSIPHTDATKTDIARLLAVNTDPFINEVVLDRGAHTGVYEGQPVIDAKGIMGEVIQVGTLTSRVMLITDLRSAIPVQDTRNGVRGIAVGRGNLSQLALTDIPTTVDIKPGDNLVSSGLDGHYPAGYPVGVVSRVHQDPGEQFTAIDITPSAQLDRNQFVLLLWPPQTPAIDAPKSQQPIIKTNKTKAKKIK